MLGLCALSGFFFSLPSAFSLGTFISIARKDGMLLRRSGLGRNRALAASAIRMERSNAVQQPGGSSADRIRARLPE